jgi:hypothetical protein
MFWLGCYHSAARNRTTGGRRATSNPIKSWWWTLLPQRQVSIRHWQEAKEKSLETDLAIIIKSIENSAPALVEKIDEASAYLSERRNE